MADRVALFNQSRMVQVGSPEEIYDRPRTRFVADFVGGSNVIEPKVAQLWTGGPDNIIISEPPARARKAEA
jgi:putative spermidine/putrescine transport system ATP-binding protein